MLASAEGSPDRWRWLEPGLFAVVFTMYFLPWHSIPQATTMLGSGPLTCAMVACCQPSDEPGLIGTCSGLTHDPARLGLVVLTLGLLVTAYQAWRWSAWLALLQVFLMLGTILYMVRTLFVDLLFTAHNDRLPEMIFFLGLVALIGSTLVRLVQHLRAFRGREPVQAGV